MPRIIVVSKSGNHDTPILKEEDEAVLKFRLALIDTLARTLRHAMALLGISLPERM